MIHKHTTFATALLGLALLSPFTQSLASNKKTSENTLGWQINLVATQGTLHDRENFVGVDASATNGYDAGFDTYKSPTPPGNFVRLFMKRPDWESILGDEFGRDIREQISLADTMQVWDFTVLTNKTGQVNVEFDVVDEANFPEVPIFLVDKSDGSKFKLANNGSSISIDATANVEYQFSLYVGDVTAPELSAGQETTTANLFLAAGSYDFDWSSSDRNGVVKSMFEFSADRGETWEVVGEWNQAVDGTTWTAPTVDRLMAPYFRITVEDFAGNKTSIVDDTDFAVAGNALSYQKAAGWALVGSANSESEALSGIFGNNAPYFSAFKYDGAGYLGTSMMESLNGLWLGTLEQVTYTFTGVPYTGEVTASLPIGWSILSAPYILDIPVSDLKFALGDAMFSYQQAISNELIGGMFGYDGSGYFEPEVLSEGNAFWIVTLMENVKIHYPFVYPAVEMPAKVKETEPMLVFKTGELGKQSVVMLGFADGATNGFDSKFDRIAPPAMPDPRAFSLAIVNEGNSPFSNRIHKSIKSLDGAAKSWTLRVDGDSDRKTNLTWSGELLKKGTWTVRTSDGVVFDLNSLQSIEVAGGSELTVSFDAFATSVESTEERSLSLHQNYPNPFNPSTSIRFDLPAAQNVSLKVYNMVGQEIATVFAGNKPAGSHTVSFDASKLSSGVYLYRLQAGNTVMMKKMVLMK